MRSPLLADEIPSPLVRVLRSRRARREWENVRAFRLLFSSGDETVLLTTVSPSIGGAIRYSTDGEPLPSFLTVQHPRLHTLRADEVLSCVEIDLPRTPPRPRRARTAARRRRRRAM